MKPAIFKNFIISLIFLVGLSIIAWPIQSLAVSRNTNTTVTEKVQTAFCDKLSTVSSKITNRLTEREGNINGRQDIRITNLKTKRDQRKQKLAEHRTYWDGVRTSKYGELEAKAITDEQKQAILTFQNTVEAAVKTRREAIDAAITQFQNDVDSAVLIRQSSVDQAVEKYKNSVQVALSKAQSDCTAGTDVATIRTELKNSLESARATLQTDRSNIDKVSDGVETAITTRKAAVKAAWTTFKITLETAKDELKKSFSETN